jgi:uncharacterized pyridoxamine 5'-phosphate oxidase family protein
MNFQDYVTFANENPVCYLATAEGDQPRVRALMMWYADETGFYFQSQSVKALYKQLEKNQNVEVLYYAPEDNGGKVMRVSGKVKFIEDTAMRAKVIDERPFLKEMGIKDPENPLLAIFHLYTGEAYFWTREDSMRESEIERVKF